jgi:hypothetical protein
MRTCGGKEDVVERRPEKPEPLAVSLVSFLVVGKLFLVDLIGVEAIWRVLLFLDFGSLFLALSYYLRFLGHPMPETLAMPNALMYRNSRSYPQHVVDKGLPIVEKCITCNKGVTPFNGERWEGVEGGRSLYEVEKFGNTFTIGVSSG